MLEVGAALIGDPVGAGVLLHFLGTYGVDARRVQTEDLGAQRRRNFGIAVHRAQLRRDLESAKRLDLVLRRTVPDRVGAPQHVVLTAILDELAERMRRAVGIAHEKAPGAAELGINVAVRLDPVLDQRADERVDAVARATPRKRALRDTGDKTRVVNEEAHIRETLGDDADVAALAVLVGLLAEGQSLVHADHFHAKSARLLDEADADVVRQKKTFAVHAPLGVGLPRAHFPALFQLVHRLKIARLIRIDPAVDQ